MPWCENYGRLTRQDGTHSFFFFKLWITNHSDRQPYLTPLSKLNLVRKLPPAPDPFGFWTYHPNVGVVFVVVAGIVFSPKSLRECLGPHAALVGIVRKAMKSLY